MIIKSQVIIHESLTTNLLLPLTNPTSEALLSDSISERKCPFCFGSSRNNLQNSNKKIALLLYFLKTSIFHEETQFLGIEMPKVFAFD